MFGKGIADHLSLRCSVALSVLAVAFAAGAGAQSSGSSCATAIEVDLDATLRREASEAAGSTYFKVSPAAAGVLALDVVAPGDPADRPVLGVLGTSCDPPGGEGIDFTFIRVAPAWAAIEMLAGETLYFELSAENPDKELPALKLRTAFVPDLTTPDEELEPGQDSTGTCGAGGSSISTASFADDRYVAFTEGFNEWDRDILSGIHAGPGAVLIRAAGVDLDAELFAGTSCAGESSLGAALLVDAGDRLGALAYPGDHRLVLDPYNGAEGEYTLSFKFFDLCSAGEVDDHGDGFACAREVGSESETAGLLDNAAADDGDVFTFSLSSQRTIQVETTGTTDTYGILCDKDGQRLDWDDDGGEDANFSLTKTLTAGRYFVRVEGAGGAEGDYDLALAHVSSP